MIARIFFTSFRVCPRQQGWNVPDLFLVLISVADVWVFGLLWPAESLGLQNGWKNRVL